MVAFHSPWSVSVIPFQVSVLINGINRNIIESRYHMTEENAANTASYLLAGPIILYPMVEYTSAFELYSLLTIL